MLALGRGRAGNGSVDNVVAAPYVVIRPESLEPVLRGIGPRVLVQPLSGFLSPLG